MESERREERRGEGGAESMEPWGQNGGGGWWDGGEGRVERKRVSVSVSVRVCVSV